MRSPMKFALASLVSALACSAASAATEIQWWHSMTGALGDRVNSIAAQFNESQKDYKVVPVFKGSYDESMAAGIAAFRAGNAPHILQVFEVGTATMMASSKAIKPVQEMMTEAGEKFDPKSYVPAVAGYYTNRKGQMLSFPFNSSTTVFYYNKDAFKKAGLDANNPPKTWVELTAAAAKIKLSGSTCPYTTAWQSWVQLESFSTWHNVPFATEGNGLDGDSPKLQYNSPLHVRHISNMQNWLKQGLFVYAGRKSEPEGKFFNGECAMMTASSATYGNIKKNAKFEFGVAPLPYYPDVAGAPQNTIIGGASLWVMAGKKAEEYKGVAKFFTYLSKPEIQAVWHQETGYLPVTMAAYDLTRKSGFYDKNPGTDVAVKQMILKTTAISRGVRLGNFVQIRNINDEELENVWNGKKDAKQALDDAVTRGNEEIAKFSRANKQ